MSPIKFAGPDELPDGFLYRDGFLSEPEEAELLRIFQGLEFAAYDYHGYLAKRRVARYGVNYDLNTREPNENVLPIPDFLLGIRARGAEVAEVTAEKLVQAMVSEYSIGTPIGWHRDAPQFGIIIGISLGSTCRMRLKPYQATGKVLSLWLEPRSIYVIKGDARSGWQHSIPAVEQLRYSITFRTLRFRPRRVSARKVSIPE
ncbi:MAG TPA: alpha-ketoglutarate-dependent dioxygenase AlkB [Candidatus Sulfotelmatobacter sp.]|nr:alpha-ketoglutarate-dependent dioxygenase AlkB [Candidatus Sulfotelmatobacter sp.]